MDNNQLDQLQDEQIKGGKADKAYENWVKPFIDAKRKVLFEAFKTIPISQKEDLIEIKRMLQTVDAFELEIQSFIDTGKMASRVISEMKPDNEETH